MQSNGSYFFKGDCQVLLKNAAMLHVSQPYVGAVCWGRDRLTPAKISGSFLIGKGGWLMIWFTLSPHSYFSAMLRQEFPRRRIFFLQDQNTWLLFWVLLPTFSMTFLKATCLSLLPFPSHPSPYACCQLFMVSLSKGILNVSIIPKQWFFCVCQSLAPDIQHVTQRSPKETNALSTVGSSVLGLTLLWIFLLLEFDPKSTEVEEFYTTSAQISPRCLQMVFQ